MEFRTVHTLEEGLEELARFGEDAKVLAGGTDLILQLKRGEISAPIVLNIEPLRALDFIHNSGGAEIGALTTHRTIADSSVLYVYTSLRHAANQVGGWQTQMVGTIGGNICNASPAADTLPPLLVHGAEVQLISAGRGPRWLALEDFIEGRRKTACAADEILVGLRLEPVKPRSSDAYYKVGRRAAMEIAIAGVATRVTVSSDGNTIEDARVAVCSVGPRAYRASAVETFLRGQAADPTVIKEAGELLVASTSAIDDIRSSRDYRQRVLPRVLTHLINECIEAARIGIH